MADRKMKRIWIPQVIAILILVWALLSLTFYINILSAQEIDPYQLIEAMTERTFHLKTLEYENYMHERIGNKYVDKSSFFKIELSPFKLFVRQSFIGITIEGLYNSGFNNNKLLITTVGFPWIQITLDPLGERVRKNHHHTIFEAGFTYFVEVIDNTMKNHRNEISLSYEGDKMVNDKICYIITFNVNNFHYYNYTVQPGENLSDIAKQLYINDYLLLEKNPKIKYYDKVKPGQIILVPSAYAKRMVLYLDKELLLPIQIEIYDDKGLYSSYSYKKLIVNQEFAWNEFNTIFKEYHFR